MSLILIMFFILFLFSPAFILCSSGDVTVNGNSARIEVVVPNVSQLTRDGFESSAATVRGIFWTLKIKRNGDNLELSLRAPSEIEPGTYGAIKRSDTYDVEGTFELLPCNSSGESIKKTFDPEESSSYFKWGAAIKGSKEFMNWNNFMNSGFVCNDQARFAIEFAVKEPFPLLERPNPTLP